MTILSKENYIVSVGLGTPPADNIEIPIERHTEANTKGFEENEIPGWMPGGKINVRRQIGQEADTTAGSA